MKGSKSLNQHLSCKLGAYVIVHFCFLSFYEFTKNKSKGAESKHNNLWGSPNRRLPLLGLIDLHFGIDIFLPSQDTTFTISKVLIPLLLQQRNRLCTSFARTAMNYYGDILFNLIDFQ